MQDSVAYHVGGPYIQQVSAMYAQWVSRVECVISAHHGWHVFRGTDNGVQATGNWLSWDSWARGLQETYLTAPTPAPLLPKLWSGTPGYSSSDTTSSTH
eukprot:2984817-Pyramimonas_sp.AAC.1